MGIDQIRSDFSDRLRKTIDDHSKKAAGGNRPDVDQPDVDDINMAGAARTGLSSQEYGSYVRDFGIQNVDQLVRECGGPEEARGLMKFFDWGRGEAARQLSINESEVQTKDAMGMTESIIGWSLYLIKEVARGEELAGLPVQTDRVGAEACDLLRRSMTMDDSPKAELPGMTNLLTSPRLDGAMLDALQYIRGYKKL